MPDIFEAAALAPIEAIRTLNTAPAGTLEAALAYLALRATSATGLAGGQFGRVGWNDLQCKVWRLFVVGEPEPALAPEYITMADGRNWARMNDTELLATMQAATAAPIVTVPSATLARLLVITGYGGKAAKAALYRPA